MFLLEFSYGQGPDQQGTGRSLGHNYSSHNVLGAGSSGNDDRNDRLQKAIARNRAKQEQRNNQAEVKTQETFSTRRTVATPDTIEFTSDLSKSVPKVSRSVVGYSTAKRKVKTKSKNKVASSKKINYLVRIGWFFCLFLFFRLFFADGGVVDYYSSLDLLNSKKQDYLLIISENEKLMGTIKKIQADPRYQRKLVRDNLGFIASNEYLILFPKERESLSN